VRAWWVVCFGLMMCGAVPAGAAIPPPVPLLRVFLDCSESDCDFTYLRQQMTYVDWVRERREAEVYVLVIPRTTGSGGTRYELFVTRLEGHGPAADTLRVETPPGASDDAARRTLMTALQAVVARDLAERPELGRMSLTIRPDRYNMPTADPWHGWVFSLSVNGYASGEHSARSGNLSGNVYANRTTEESKFEISGYGNYDESRYTFDDGSTYLSIRRGHGAAFKAANSISPHFSAGSRAFYSASTFSNVKREVGGGVGLEFDVWPYRESSRRLLTLGYEFNGRWVDYEEVTLYDKTGEQLWRHNLVAKLAGKQPWGSVSVSGLASTYLHDTEKYRTTVSGNLSFNLARGFSLNLSGYASRVHDLLSLRRSGASDTEVLARQRQIDTSFDYAGSLGVSYTFGSIYNSVVNPRMDAIFGRF